MEKLISVKIPTYNCAKYLEEALTSVLNQKCIDLDILDIEVIDDYSSKDDPKSIVDKFGKGRVKFYRNKKNIGAVNNFNVCLSRCKTKYLHILHGDDYLDELFYFEMLALIRQNREAQIFTSRSFFVDINGNINGNSIEIYNKQFIEIFRSGTPIQFAGVIVRTAVMKKLNGFDPSLIHVNDRDMWLRMINSDLENWVHSNLILSFYRIFDGNDSSNLIKQGRNIPDLYRYYKKNQSILELTDEQIFKIIYKFFRNQFNKLTSLKSCYLNILIILEILGFTRYFSYEFSGLIRRIKKYLKKKVNVRSL